MEGKCKKYAELHLHSLDRFDSQNDPEEVCRIFSEMGAKGFALTQHGVMTALEPMREAAKPYGLKVIPGIEAYIEVEDSLQTELYHAGAVKTPFIRAHMILLAKDTAGYRELVRFVTEANDTDRFLTADQKDGYAVASEELLKKHFGPGTSGHGHVIATSACIQGAVAVRLRENETLDKAKETEQKKLEKAGKGLDLFKVRETYLAGKTELEELDRRIASVKAERTIVSKTAGKSFKKLENQLERLAGKNDPAYSGKKEELDRLKDETQNAKAKLEDLKKELAELSAKRTALNRKIKAAEPQILRCQKAEEAVRKIDSYRVSDMELMTKAKRAAEIYRDLFGKDESGNPCFYMEVQNHFIKTEAFVYPREVSIAKELGIPLVASNDVHILKKNKEEIQRREMLMYLRFNHLPETRKEDAELYIKTDDEMREALSKILPENAVEEAMSNIRAIFDRCDTVIPDEKHYPKYTPEDGSTSEEAFDQAIRDGIRWRFPEGMDEEHEKRLRHEIPIIKSMGYMDYHLIVKDFLEYGRLLGAVPEERLDETPLTMNGLKKWIKDNGWHGGFSIGPGRGSAVGSLVCYLLGITSLDPLKYGLLFERFLNPERVSMPDIDSGATRCCMKSAA